MFPSDDEAWLEEFGPDAPRPTDGRSAPTLLVVDDVDAIRAILGGILHGQGYRVATARHGAEALAYLQERPDTRLILLDLHMPVMDAREFRIRQLADPRIAGIPVVLMSGGTDVRHHAEKLGLTDYLSKPFEVDDLLAIIERYCG